MSKKLKIVYEGTSFYDDFRKNQGAGETIGVRINGNSVERYTVDGHWYENVCHTKPLVKLLVERNGKIQGVDIDGKTVYGGHIALNPQKNYKEYNYSIGAKQDSSSKSPKKGLFGLNRWSPLNIILCIIWYPIKLVFFFWLADKGNKR